MRFASIPGYYPSFPVKYSNMYNDFVVSYIGRNEPKFEMNNPHYMREVSRSYSDKIPPVILNKEPIQNRF